MKKFIEGEDYYFNEKGLMVFTSKFLLERGRCCGRKCENCPYNHINVPKEKVHIKKFDE